MEQSAKYNEKEAEVIARKFSRPTLKRLQAMNERAINELLDEAEADQEIADAIDHAKKFEPNDIIPYAEFKTEDKQQHKNW